jgi:hypothetical protein
VADTDAASNPYAVIIQKNAFRLNPPPPPPAPAASEKQDLPVVVFSGTVAVGDQMCALLAVTIKDSRKNDKSGTTSYLNLAEGETEGPVQLLKISPDGESVDILNSGTPRTLTMKDDGFARVASASAAPTPPGPTTTRQPPPGRVAPPGPQGPQGAPGAPPANPAGYSYGGTMVGGGIPGAGGNSSQANGLAASSQQIGGAVPGSVGGPVIPGDAASGAANPADNPVDKYGYGHLYLPPAINVLAPLGNDAYTPPPPTPQPSLPLFPTATLGGIGGAP